MRLQLSLWPAVALIVAGLVFLFVDGLRAFGVGLILGTIICRGVAELILWRWRPPR